MLVRTRRPASGDRAELRSIGILCRRSMAHTASSSSLTADRRHSDSKENLNRNRTETWGSVGVSMQISRANIEMPRTCFSKITAKPALTLRFRSAGHKRSKCRDTEKERIHRIRRLHVSRASKDLCQFFRLSFAIEIGFRVLHCRTNVEMKESSVRMSILIR